MIRQRFLWKLYAGYAVLIALTATLVGLLVAPRIASESIEEIDRNLIANARLLAEIADRHLEAGPDPAFDGRIEALGTEIGVRLTVVDAGGQVLADSEEDARLMQDHGQRPEILQALDHGVGRATRRSDTLGLEMTYVALAVRAPDGRLRGFVRTAFPLTAREERLSDLRDRVVLAIGVATLAALVLGYAFARRVTGPLALMTRAAEAIAEGREEATVRAGGRDEIGRLARAFQRMSGTLRERMDTIERDRGQLRAILSSMVEGVVAVDRDERVVHLNEVAAGLLHADPAEAVGRRIWEVTRIREVCEALESVLGGASEIRGEARVAGHGPERSIEIHAAPLRSGEGEVAGGVVVLHDVTELRRLESIRRDFVANVSHELKTPLTAIRGFLETLLDDDSVDPATTRRFLARSRDQANRLSALVADLLTLSRFESIEGPLEAEPQDLAALVHESVAGFRGLAREKGLALEAEIPGEIAPVPGDRDALRQLADNLISNAILYTPPGGRVRVRLVRTGDRVLLEVQDTGIGIDPRHQERIFERFYRVDKARSRELGGTGLGLSIVKHIALAHGGRVSLESAPGRGSTFRVQFSIET